MDGILPEVIVAGHICLDIIPFLDKDVCLVPGTLINVGLPTIATGGAVANTGIALHKLGIPVRLVGMIGNDAFGRIIEEILLDISPKLNNYMVKSSSAISSYTLVISPPNADRSFLHCSGANDDFGADNISHDVLAGASHFHFGYPPLMNRMYLDGGRELAEIFSKAKNAGLTTSLDLAMPNAQSDPKKHNWLEIFQRVLPMVDIFFPSFEELRQLLLMSEVVYSKDAVFETCLRTFDLGAKLIVMKCADKGLSIHSNDDAMPKWQNMNLQVPCFKVQVAGTTGAGDTTIAGFLAGFLRGLSPEKIVETAVAVGACCCEKTDATSGIPSWEILQQRISSNWNRLD